MTPPSLGFGDVEDSGGRLTNGFFNFAPVCFIPLSFSRPCKRITLRDTIVEDPRHEDDVGSLEIGAIYNSWPRAYGCCEQRCSRACRFYIRCVRFWVVDMIKSDQIGTYHAKKDKMKDAFYPFVVVRRVLWVGIVFRELFLICVQKFAVLRCSPVTNWS
jgi:hypothetical protein